MSLLDALNKDEASFFTELMKRQVEIFNRDFELLFNGKVKIAQPSFGCLGSKKIIAETESQSALIIMRWEGGCVGDVVTVLKSTEVKILRGLLMMMQASAIEISLKSAITEQEINDLKEIASQVNTSHDNAIHEIVTINFRSTLKSVEIYDPAMQGDVMNAIFADDKYLLHSGVLKITDFPDGVITQYYPLSMMQKLLKLEKVGIDKQKSKVKKVTKTILLIDKDALARGQIKGLLRDATINFIEADDNIKALQLLMRTNVDLVFLDLGLAERDNFDICKRIQTNPRLKNIPVIVCSEKCSKEDVVNALSRGARDVLLKPIGDRELLEQKITRHLD